MIRCSQARLGVRPEIRYVVSDFNSLEINAEYDVAVSSLALHHLATDGDKRQFYRRIYDGLHSAASSMTRRGSWIERFAAGGIS